MYTLVRARATIDHDQDTTYRQCHKYGETGAYIALSCIDGKGSVEDGVPGAI